jgi:hypothetical protein
MRERPSCISGEIAQALYELEEESEIWSPYFACIPVPFTPADLGTWIVGTRRFTDGDMQKFVLLAIAEGIIVPAEAPGTYRFS